MLPMTPNPKAVRKLTWGLISQRKAPFLIILDPFTITKAGTLLYS